MIFYTIFSKVTNVMFRVLYKIELNGVENLPQQGRAVICSNHVGVADPVLLTAVLPIKLNYMGKKELFDNKFIGYWLRKLGAFPVDRDASGLSAIKMAIKTLKEDKIFAMFPQGTRTREEDGTSVKPGVAMITIKGRSTATPIHIETDYKLFKKITINIGKPLYFDKYFDRKVSTEEYVEVSQYILKEIYKLK